LGTYIAPEILPANVLVRTSELLVWWTVAQHRTLFFGEQSEAGKDLNGKRYPVPPLVFKVSGGCLWVRALEGNERPTAKTKLKTAPFWNGNEAGEICIGTMRIPESCVDGWRLGAWILSDDTHANGAARLTSFPGGFLALCRHLAGNRRPFPVEYLTDARETLQQFVERR
jgi:PRTRC genetic system protein B